MASTNRTRIAVGVFAMIACALAAGVAFTTAADRSPALVIARPVTAGSTIESSDLREELVGSSPAGSTVAANRRSSIVGRTAAVDLLPGSLLSSGQVADGPAAGTGQAVVGATLKEGQFPVELGVGDRVLAIVLPSESAEPSGAVTPSSVSATVVGVRPLDDGGGIAVSLAVAPDRAPSLAVAGARARLSLVLAPR
jgi:Flp pilus assembly protein CpaB